MQKPIAALIDTVLDPLAADILYHHSRWTNILIKNNEGNNCSKDIRIDDARNLLQKDVNEVLFQEKERECEREREREKRSLGLLLND